MRLLKEIVNFYVYESAMILKILIANDGDHGWVSDSDIGILTKFDEIFNIVPRQVTGTTSLS